VFLWQVCNPVLWLPVFTYSNYAILLVLSELNSFSIWTISWNNYLCAFDLVHALILIYSVPKSSFCFVVAVRTSKYFYLFSYIEFFFSFFWISVPKSSFCLVVAVRTSKYFYLFSYIEFFFSFFWISGTAVINIWKSCFSEHHDIW